MSVALIVLLEGLFALFLAIRRDPVERSRSQWDWSTALCGTITPLLFRPTTATRDLVWGDMIQVLGTTLAVYGVVCLNRSIGITPANRGIKSRGLYRWVRHPLYASYTLAHAGYVLTNWSARNCGIWVIALLFQLIRIHNEEQLLSRDRNYVEYKARTPYRLIPFIF
jgi:protein-S-isoprenylcysteine O-methyltransferase Ste14